ncbi:STAS domain-containing protein [filamentous cyanobacterium LEGE 11480]|uniref:Anti-sigma factor antagonist n=1 Tax=Romeriopsis navalis LEGE 11480 TaxID=2777977 RepID=A0A928VKK5_9CYAN|nr:STAS domain-containing protein [Romeriopsis navalis]MBE9029367.1 STAS domain-containing protein [Romeriopsis navalis LEGE 11480]
MQSLLSRAQGSLVRAQGHVNAATASELETQIHQAVKSEATAVLVDMGQVESLDSAGLMALVSSLTLAQQLNKRLSLCSMPANVQIILEMTQLDQVFEILPSPAAFELA